MVRQTSRAFSSTVDTHADLFAKVLKVDRFRDTADGETLIAAFAGHELRAAEVDGRETEPTVDERPSGCRLHSRRGVNDAGKVVRQSRNNAARKPEHLLIDELQDLHCDVGTQNGRGRSEWNLEPPATLAITDPFVTDVSIQPHDRVIEVHDPAVCDLVLDVWIQRPMIVGLGGEVGNRKIAFHCDAAEVHRRELDHHLARPLGIDELPRLQFEEQMRGRHDARRTDQKSSAEVSAVDLEPADSVRSADEVRDFLRHADDAAAVADVKNLREQVGNSEPSDLAKITTCGRRSGRRGRALRRIVSEGLLRFHSEKTADEKRPQWVLTV